MRLYVAGLLLAIVFMAAPVNAQGVRFVADVDFAPYSMMVEGKPAGIDVDVLTEAARRIDLELDLELLPWESVKAAVKDGSTVGAMAMFHSPERDQVALFLDAVPIHYSDYVIFTKVGKKFSFRTYDDLKSKKIGKVAGVLLGDEFAKAGAEGGMEIREYPSLAQAIKGLLMGEIDGFAGNMDVTYNRLKTMGMTSSIVYLPKKISTQQPAYVVMSRASKYVEKQSVMQELQRALEIMRKDGTYNKIARRYLIRF